MPCSLKQACITAQNENTSLRLLGCEEGKEFFWFHRARRSWDGRGSGPCHDPFGVSKKTGKTYYADWREMADDLHDDFTSVSIKDYLSDEDAKFIDKMNSPEYRYLPEDEE